MLKNFLPTKQGLQKNALSLLSLGPTHHSVTFSSRFLYELKHKVHLSKSVCAIFHFSFHLLYMKVYIFVNKKYGLFCIKTP